jgi:hypothetical protein
MKRICLSLLYKADLTHVAHDSWKEFRNGTDILTTHNTHSLSGQLCYAPQLFYGQCTSVEGNKVIHFSEKNAADSISSTYPLSGVLYRGMAKVQLTLKIDKLNQSGALQWIEVELEVGHVGGNVGDVHLYAHHASIEFDCHGIVARRINL